MTRIGALIAIVATFSFLLPRSVGAGTLPDITGNDLLAPSPYRLSNQFTGPRKCLDVINDGRNDRLTLAKCGNYSGQLWWAKKTAQGYVRLKNTFTGSGKCLDVINDGWNDRLTLAECGNYSGQMWSIDH